ncbi:MAG: flagellar hook-associated protein FlgK [Candidatus Hydrogenedens sp.]|nr:flagellar hook-associated protein FlgK [Candidatus Hydrogenedens sp.]
MSAQGRAAAPNGKGTRVGTLFSALDIGRGGLQVAQVQLDTAGHNIASVNKEGFSRQRVELLTRDPNVKTYGAIGRGVYVSGIARLRDRFLDVAYRQENSSLGNAQQQAIYFQRLEDIFDEPGDTGLSTRLNQFFDSLQDFAGNVDDVPTRVATLEEAQALAGVFNDVDRRLRILRTNANDQIKDAVKEINSLADRIAELNDTILGLELSGNTANDLRDDRDLLLDELSGLANISFNERDNGVVDVLFGGEQLVTGNRVNELETVANPALDPNRNDLVEVRYVASGSVITPRDGELAGLFQIRDVELAGVENRADDLARELIRNMNSLQASGRGLAPYSGAITTSNPVSGNTTPFNSAGLPFPVNNGSFDIQVYDNAGNLVETVSVGILASVAPPLQTTLSVLQFQIDLSPNLNTTLNPDGTLTISPIAGRTFTFANDTSGALTALGLNTFFNGSEAGSIRVNQTLVDQPELVSSGSDPDLTVTGDNSIALQMAQLRDANILDGGTQNFNQFYETTLVEVGINSRANEQLLAVQENAAQDFDFRRQEVSGVSIDEEITQLIQFQRAFEASARVITVADNLLGTLIDLVR